MASHKKLQSVAYSVAHSFTSPMNYGADGYVMGNLVLAALKKKKTHLHFDLLTDSASPKALLVRSVAQSIAWYREGFRGLVDRSGSSMDFVVNASVEIELDLAKQRPSGLESSVLEVPFVCLSHITDDRSKTYHAKIGGWWSAEQ